MLTLAFLPKSIPFHRPFYGTVNTRSAPLRRQRAPTESPEPKGTNRESINIILLSSNHVQKREKKKEKTLSNAIHFVQHC